ncbi:PREDICTED: NADH dehydrogenase [ubiquinone] 1 alpha subcomplex subunit 8 [Dufourea novaeangliae]|uniref:NADH dehydrogenase [ubiquinone] 1 alpha subcomplex subunit 8 n=1 Tax=Dufourea novaeangliae TaxID=178035 RepID=A0A154PHN5_DUFNO|nr:PREDICTED: NADH dehydrogenase [ubiquinone] 1 alpha subcomplex subunit 8 [Dufourea novaeangliae]KZC11365.1 NADH dehydrogenase [ubiquinone] 1 alpha subcomplex subunit 8 [Dufourea novaeangliae]
MVITEKTTLPSDEELTVQEINVSWPLLQAASFYIGKKCEWDNNEFMLCKQETKDPRKCIQEGKNVTACALGVFQGIKKHCLDDFNKYVRCLERSSGTLDMSFCRKTQAALDNCVLTNLNIERPPFGYFCEAKVHDSPRPKPEVYVFIVNAVRTAGLRGIEVTIIFVFVPWRIGNVYKCT